METPPRSVVVTGANGYVGRHVVTALADLGIDTVAVVRPGRADGVDARARVVEQDVLAPDLDVAALVGDETDVLIHLAWQDGFDHRAPSHRRRLSAHFDLVTGAVAAGVGKVAALGSMHEIGYWEGAVAADTPTNPASLYGVAKDALRRSTRLALDGSADWLWLRAFYITGDDRRNKSIFTRLLEAADRGETEFPFTSGRHKYDFIDVARLGRQIAVAATSPEATGILNVCSGQPLALADRVEAFIAEQGLGIALQYGAFPDRPYDSPAVWGDAAAIRTVMDRSPFGFEG